MTLEQMARSLSPLKLNIELQEILQTITRSREVPHSLVQRAQIVLSASTGSYNKVISQDLGLCEETVGFWRKRWIDNTAELEKFKDKPKQLRDAVSQVLADRPAPGSPGHLRRNKFANCWQLRVKRPRAPQSLDAAGTGPDSDQSGYCRKHISQQCRAFFKIRGI